MSIVKLFIKEMSMTSAGGDASSSEGYNEPMYLKKDEGKKKKKKKKKSPNAVVRYGFYGMMGRDYKPVQVPEEDKDDDSEGGDSGGDGGGGGE